VDREHKRQRILRRKSFCEYLNAHSLILHHHPEHITLQVVFIVQKERKFNEQLIKVTLAFCAKILQNPPENASLMDACSPRKIPTPR